MLKKLINACQNNNLDDIRTIILEESSLNSIDATVLFDIIRDNSININTIRFLIIKATEICPQSINPQKGSVPLTWAVRKNNPELVQFLIMMGADVNGDGGMPLFEAITSDNACLTTLLLELGANVEDEELNEFIDHSTKTGKIIERYKKEISNDNERFNNRIQQNKKQLKLEELYRAAVNNDGNTLEYLLNKKVGDEQFVNPNELFISGATLLHIAVLNDHKDAVEQLVKAGADPHVLDSQHKTAIDRCYQMSNNDIFNLLFPEYKQKKEERLLTNIQPATTALACEHERAKNLYQAAATGNSEKLKNIIAKPTAEGQARVDPNIKFMPYNTTALHGAVFGGHKQAVALLLEAGADPYSLNATGDTPIDINFKLKNKEIFDLLVIYGQLDGANSKKREKGNAPLESAANIKNRQSIFSAIPSIDKCFVPNAPSRHGFNAN